MSLVRAHIVPAAPDDAEVESSARLPLLSPLERRRIAKDVMAADELARGLVAQAEAEAASVLAAARRSAETTAREAAIEARREEESKLAAAYLHMKRADEARATRDLDHAVALAVILAERLLGHALALEPTRVRKLAEQALAEARGARRATVEACAEDVEALRGHLASAAFPEGAVDIRVDSSLSRGSLRIVTELGTLDARLEPQLDRLARALRDTLDR